MGPLGIRSRSSPVRFPAHGRVANSTVCNLPSPLEPSHPVIQDRDGPTTDERGKNRDDRERKVMAALIRLVAAIVLCAATGWGALAQDDADFFRNKTTKFMITFEPGGSYDLYARLAATYLPKHIPGQPAMAVQYHPGAGGLI